MFKRYTYAVWYVEDFQNFIHVMCDMFKRYTYAVWYVEDFRNFIHVMCDVFKRYTYSVWCVEYFGNFIHVMCDVFKRYTCAISPGMIFGMAGFLKYGWLEIMWHYDALFLEIMLRYNVSYLKNLRLLGCGVYFRSGKKEVDLWWSWFWLYVMWKKRGMVFCMMPQSLCSF